MEASYEVLVIVFAVLLLVIVPLSLILWGLPTLFSRNRQSQVHGSPPRTIRVREGELAFPDTPHVIVDVDSPAAFCESCGAPVEVRLARLSGYDSETGLPRYKLVRACSHAVLYETFDVVWQTDIRRHTVQGPTDTRMVLGVAVILLCILVIFLVMPDTSPKATPKYPLLSDSLKD